MGWLCIKWWLPLFCAIFVVEINGCNGYFQEEKRALLDYKEFLKFHNYSAESLLVSWVSDSKSDCCSWENVMCDSSTGHVIHLSHHAEYRWSRCEWPLYQTFSLNLSLFKPLKELQSLNLSYNCFDGLILTEDYKNTSILTKLERLDLSDNWIDGMFPTKELSVLENLKSLDLSHNYLNLKGLDLSHNYLESPNATQDVNDLSRLKKLKFLNLGGNIFNEEIFKYLSPLPELRSLFLYNNDIGGALKGQGLCNMKTLEELDLSFNILNGIMDTCLDNLTSLRRLDLSYNNLGGSIHSTFLAAFPSLEYLSLLSNNFEGSFSLSVFANHSRLKVLSIGEMKSNKFQLDTENPSNWFPLFQLKALELPNCQLNSTTGKMPSFLLHQHDLEYIDLYRNNLVGAFPSWLLVNNTKLEYFFLNDNCFNGSFQLPIHINEPMNQLVVFDISNNNIQGWIPKNIGFIFPHLTLLSVSSNKFDGEIPATIGEMSNLSLLYLDHNNFSGEIPKRMLIGCISLTSLRLSHNSLHGTLFPTPSTWKDLSVLMMDNNLFNETIEDGMLSMNNLQALDISNNRLSGRLPASWPRELRFFSVSSNNYEGEIPKDLCKLPLQSINLSHNRFFGSIPSCFNTSMLVYIDLQGNSLTGTIHGALSRAHLLEIIDLRDNKISGSIPKGIYGLSQLKFLLLGGNALEGELSKEICK
ncbi:hypothetical protein L6164_037040 [Bauhinia variegata]|uniref:Uncharacterized protein n=1 Tax=Bauhinia variegata TaxID=167791 RepID=A0ACB9KIZ7_BAUVA|nr:hypothetical protein L6164_037040 [Bauhinia variegata]